VVDRSDGCAGKFEITIVSDGFKGLMTVKRHQKVYELIREEMAE
jgi:stress-induced morphogen